MICVKRCICGFFAVLIIILNGGCSGDKRDDPAPVIRSQEGAELCDEACYIMVNKLISANGSVGCEVALPVHVQDGGTIECAPDAGTLGCISCTEWCIEQHANGVYWNTKCIIDQIFTCDEIETVCNVQ